MGRESEETDLAGALAFEEQIHNAALLEYGVKIVLHIGQTMELVEVEVIGAETFQGPVELVLGPGALALRGFAGEEDLFPVRFESGAELDFGVAVGRRDIEVIDAALNRLGHNAVGVPLPGIGDDNAAKPDDGQFHGGFAVSPAGHCGGRPGCCFHGVSLGVGAAMHGGRHRTRAQLHEGAPFHGGSPLTKMNCDHGTCV